jgi:DtxR family transcriptional regulator, Mn-dependent transcriptional regulator
MADTTLVELSESMQMYLVTIARLREDGQPVPLSLLAETLAISPVSVNEMCRKLQDQGLVIYRPYKGASLTDEGEERACYILRRHRLWEVFLVDRLGFHYDEAHEVACQLEHATPEDLADRLDHFLDYPPVNPEGEPIPRCSVKRPDRPTVALATLTAGQRGRVLRCDLEGASRSFLDEQGIRSGAWLVVIAASGDGVLVQVGQAHVSLARRLAEVIQVEVEGPAGRSSTIEKPKTVKKVEEESKMQVKEEMAVKQVPLNTLKVGQRGIVVRVGSKGPVKRRMMDMGLVPGSEVSVRRVAPLGDPIEFTVKGYSLSLRKSEAQEIDVEVVD